MTKKYAVQYHKRIGNGFWEVGYYVWEGCACNKVKRIAIIEKERMPLQSDVMAWDHENCPDDILGEGA